jgi:hypothetical protein
VLWEAGVLYLDYNLNSGTLINRAGATFLVGGDLRSQSGRILNEGVFRKTSGTGVSSIRTHLQNTGVIFVDSGALQFEDGGQHRGSFNIAEGARLTFGGGQHYLREGAVIAGAGLFTSAGNASNYFDSGSVLSSGFGSVNGSVYFNPGSRSPLQDKSIDINGTVVFNSGAAHRIGTLNLSGTLDGSDQVLADTAFNWTSGTIQGAAVKGTSVEGVLNISGGADKALYVTLQNAGTAVWSAGRIYAFPNGKLRNLANASFELRGDLKMDWGSFVNKGQFLRSTGSGATTLNSVVFDNSGVVRNLSGTLSFDGGGTQSGVFNANPGARLTFAGTHSFAADSAVISQWSASLGGTMAFSGKLDVATTLDIPGSVQFRAGAVLNISVPTVNLSGTAAFNSGGPVTFTTLNLTGTIDGSDIVTVAETLNWSSGGVQGTGRLIAGPQASLAINGGSDKGLYGTLENRGSAVWSAGRIYAFPEGVLRNAASGQLSISGGTRMDWGTLHNLGQLVKTAPTNTVDLNVLMNSGTLDVNSGVLTVRGPATNSGTLAMSTNATLRFNGPRLTMEPGAQVAGPGTLLLADNVQLLLTTDVFFGNAAVRFAAVSSVTGNYRMSNGPGGLFHFSRSLTVPGSITVGGALEVDAADITLIISRNLTLLGDGTIVNPGTIRAGEFDAAPGSTVIGNAPIEIGLPPGGQFRIVSLSLAAPSGPQLLSLNLGQVSVTWVADVQSGFRVQSSTDLLNWRDHDVSPKSLGEGRFEATLDIGQATRCFFRVLRR